MTPPSVKLEAFIIYPNGDSDYRFLVDETHIKYVTISAHTLPGHRSSSNLVGFPCQPRVLGAALPPFPPGDWNVGHITTCPLTHAQVFGSTSRQSFPSVRPLWHATVVARDDLVWVGGAAGRFRQHLGLVTCRQFRGRVVCKVATFPWMVREMARETVAYQIVSQYRAAAEETSSSSSSKGPFWAPRFLGHVRDRDGRVVGFLMEYIAGRRPDKDNAVDAGLCRQALVKLHEVGLVHGRVEAGNFIIREGKRGRGSEAVLVDFAHTVALEHRNDLLEEMADLRAILEGRERMSLPVEG